MRDRDLIDRAVEAFQQRHLEVLYPDKRDFVLAGPGNRQYEAYRAALAAFCREMAKHLPDAIVSPAIAAIDDYYYGTEDAPFEGSVKAASGAALETLAALLDPEAK